MNNISFKGFYEVETIGNKKANTKLVSAMFNTIPEAVYLIYPKRSSLAFFVPTEGESQFEKLAEALKSKSLVKIRNIDFQKPTIDYLLSTRIRDFSPSGEYTYVTVSTEELKKRIDRQCKNDEGCMSYDILRLGLLDTKINIPQITIKNVSDTQNEIESTPKKNSDMPFSIQIPIDSKSIIASFIKLDYNEIPVKISKKDLETIEQLSPEAGNSLVKRKILVCPIEK